MKPGKLTKSLSFVSTYGLKRSKSLNSADVLATKALSISDASELGKFPTPVQDILLRAIEGKKIRLLLREYSSSEAEFVCYFSIFCFLSIRFFWDRVFSYIFIYI